jgi:hypothetical protein
MHYVVATVRLWLRRLKQRDPDVVTPSVTTLEFVAAGIAIDRLGGHERLASQVGVDWVERLVAGFSASDWRFVQRLVDETLESRGR